MRYFFRAEYDGTRYGGWQYQPNRTSVQQLIEEALTVVLRAPCAVTGAGRTDAGVHARAQGVHFDLPHDALFNVDTNINTRGNIHSINTDRLMTSVNALLPYDIAVYGMTPVPSDFHARYSALSRQYKYYFSDRKSPLNHNRAWALYYPMDWERIEREIASLRGVHDFTAFCSSGADSDNKICDVSYASLSAHKGNGSDGDGGNGIKIFTIRANRFIYKMVRSLVGTLADIGRGRLTDSMEAIIASKDRGRVGETAPAYGLVLDSVDYPAAVIPPCSADTTGLTPRVPSSAHISRLASNNSLSHCPPA